MQQAEHRFDGYTLGFNGMVSTLAEANSRVNSERQQRQNGNAAELQLLQMRQSSLMQDRRHIIRAITIHRQVPRPQGVCSGGWSLTIAATLIVAAFLFSVVTIEPFGLGWPGWVYCAALAVVMPFAGDRFLQEFPQVGTIRTLVTVTAGVSMATAFMFGTMRGSILAMSLDTGPGVIIEGAEDPPRQRQDSDDLFAQLQLVWALAAGGFEFSAALAIHDFRVGRRAADRGTLRRLQKEVLGVEKELLENIQRQHQLFSEPAQFEADYWSAFERGLNDGRSRRTLGRLAGVALVLLASTHNIIAADRLAVVVAIDLSQTQEASGPRGTSEFKENVAAVGKVLAGIPAGSKITVIGITNHSFTIPMTILEAHVSVDEGAFSSRLKKSRRTLVAEWNRRIGELKPSFKETDVLGAALYAGDVLTRSDARRKILLVLSDARQFTRELDLETPHAIDVGGSLKRVKDQGLIASLTGVQTYILGAGDRSGKRGTTYAQGLKQFWTQFVQLSGGSLELFSTSRDAGAVETVLGTGGQK